MLVDIHTHLLPGVDDGPKTIDDALLMARAAVAEGITHILCTPHFNEGVYMVSAETVILKVAEFQHVLDEANIPLTLMEGQEVRLSGEIPELIAKGDLLFADLDNRYLLVEFPFSDVPLYSERLLAQLCEEGYTPIIVHPERQQQFMKDPNLLIPFIEMGCLTQITSGSYVGHFGKQHEKAAKAMIEHNMAHLLASDAHNIESRGFYLKDAYEKLESDFGSEKRRIFEQYAKDVVNGDKVRVNQPIPYKKLWKWF